MNATFYTISKRINSTKLPSGGAIHEIVLKSETSIERFSILLTLADYEPYNYCSIEVNGNVYYYWLSDAKLVRNNLFLYELRMDYLATYRAYILSTTAFCRYSTRGSAMVTDPRAVISNDYVITAKGRLMSDFNMVSGMFVLLCKGNSANQTTGFCDAYALSWVTLQQLVQKITSDDMASYFANKFDQFIDKMSFNFNPWEYIVSCTWLPLIDSVFGGSVSSINLGGYDTGVTGGYMVGSKTYVADFTLDIPWDSTPEDPPSIDYQRFSPYVDVYLTLPFVGTVSINPRFIAKSLAIQIKLSIDLLTGDMIYRVRDREGYSIGYYSGNCGASIPVSNFQQDYGHFMTAGLNAITNALYRDPKGVIDVALGNVQTPTQSFVNGAISSRAFTGLDQNPNIYLEVKRNYPREGSTAPINVHGLPDGVTRQLSTISGYVQTEDASVSAPASETAINYINNALNGGVYIE